MTTAIAPPDTKAIEQEAHSLVTTANAMTVESQQDMELAGDFLKRCKAATKTLDDAYDGIIKRAHEAHKAAVAKKKELAKPFDDAVQIVKRKVGAYTAEQERIRREEEARLREEARKKAEEEALALADELEQAGDPEAAQAVIETPVHAAPVVVPSRVQKVSGISNRVNWKFRIVNASAIPRQYLIPDEKAIGAHGRSMKDRANIPGVEFFPDETVSVF